MGKKGPFLKKQRAPQDGDALQFEGQTYTWRNEIGNGRHWAGADGTKATPTSRAGRLIYAAWLAERRAARGMTREMHDAPDAPRVPKPRPPV